MNLVSLILCRKYRIHMQAIQMFLSASRLCGLCTGEDSNPEDRPRRPETDLERGCPEYTQARRISGENEKAPGRTVFEDARITWYCMNHADTENGNLIPIHLQNTRCGGRVNQSVGVAHPLSVRGHAPTFSGARYLRFVEPHKSQRHLRCMINEGNAQPGRVM